jgi:hypothetical protein
MAVRKPIAHRTAMSTGSRVLSALANHCIVGISSAAQRASGIRQRVPVACICPAGGVPDASLSASVLLASGCCSMAAALYTALM